MTDYSEASGFYLMDAQINKWSHNMVDMLGLDFSKLPDIWQSPHIVGKVTKEAASSTSLVEGIPVVDGGGDMLCSILASGASKPGDVAEISRTGSVICLISEKPIGDKGLRNLRHVIDEWVPYGVVEASGISI